MIPKQLHFIWVGEEMPKWAWNSILSFINMNPSFNPNIIQILNGYDKIGEEDWQGFITNTNENESCIIDVPEILINTFYKARSKGHFLNWKYNTFIKKGITNKKVILSDLMRFEILFQYGGIYLDCDTYPLRPFDDKLLKKKQFFSTSYDPFSKRKFIFRDNYFMGSEPERYIEYRYRDLPFCFLKGEMMYPCINRHNVKRVIFFDGDLHQQFYKDYPQEMSKGYIEHFFARSWK